MGEENRRYITTKFNRYSLICYGDHMGRKQYDCIAKIHCYIEGQKPGEKYSDSLPGITSPVLIIKFFGCVPYEKGDSIVFYPTNKPYSKDLIEKYGRICKMNLHYPISRFNDIMSILRNNEKKPLYFFIDGNNLEVGISTTSEIVEEKEEK